MHQGHNYILENMVFTLAEHKSSSTNGPSSYFPPEVLRYLSVRLEDGSVEAVLKEMS
jgi:hypothetical protein